MFLRTRATDLYQNDVEFKLVSGILGHASTQTTRIYAKPSLDMIKAAMDKSAPELNEKKPLWPDDEDENETPLLTKKSDFLLLKEITISPWAGMTNSIAISGPLTQQAKAIFYSSLKAKGLWQYKLYSDCIDILFKIYDFDIGVINISDSAYDKLIKENIISLNDFF